MRHSYESGMVVREQGPERGLGTILYIHGLGESGLSLEGIARRSELAGWRHLLPDLPGYGRSPWPELPLGLEAAMDHLAQWLETNDKRQRNREINITCMYWINCLFASYYHS